MSRRKTVFRETPLPVSALVPPRSRLDPREVPPSFTYGRNGDATAAILKRSDGVTIVGHPKTVAALATPEEHIHGNGRDLDAEQAMLPLVKITASPWQHRRPESAEELAGLKDSLLAHGLRQAVVVRRSGMGYELLAGHRRCAAAIAAGWKEIRASIQEATDAEAREIVVLENLQRKDLSAIEEAEGFQAILDAPGAPTQEQLARRLGKSQPHIANRLRLLRLPREWQELIISGEIPSSYARALLPYCEHPKARAALTAAAAHCRPTAKEQKELDAGKCVWEPPDADDLAWLMRDQMQKAAFALDHAEYDEKSGEYIRLPAKLSAAERENLDIFNDGDSQFASSWAFNRRYWLELARANAKQKGSKGAGEKGGKKAATPAAELTPAERKEQAAADARRKAERRKQLARRRKTIAVDRLRWLIADVMSKKTSQDQLLELAVLAAVKGWAHDHRDGHVNRALVKAKSYDLPDRAALLIAEIFWNSAEDCPSQIVYEGSGEVQHVAKFLGIDAAAAWQDDQMGCLSQAWWNAHDRAELVSIVMAVDPVGYDRDTAEQSKKGELVQFLIASRNVPVPVELGGKKEKLNTKATKGTKKGKKAKEIVPPRDDDDPDLADDFADFPDGDADFDEEDG